MAKYLLPCECGKKIPIDVNQAGRQITCECGALLEVPTLRGIRQLEPAAEQQEVVRQGSEWSPARGMVFAGAILSFFVGAAVTYFGYDGLRATPNISRETELQTFDKAVDDLSIEEAYEWWREVRKHGLGERGQNVYVNIRSFRDSRQRMVIIGLVLCVAGIAAALGSTFISGTKSA